MSHGLALPEAAQILVFTASTSPLEIIEVNATCHFVDQALRLNAYMDDLAHEAHDVFLVISAVRIGCDAAARIDGDLELINDPFEGTSITEHILEDNRRYP